MARRTRTGNGKRSVVVMDDRKGKMVALFLADKREVESIKKTMERGTVWMLDPFAVLAEGGDGSNPLADLEPEAKVKTQ